MIQYWNQHRIRPLKGAEGPHGRPSLMYDLPEKFGGVERKVSIDSMDLALAVSTYSVAPKQFCCSDDFNELATLLMSEHNMEWPVTRQDCEDLYLKLLDIIKNI